MSCDKNRSVYLKHTAVTGPDTAAARYYGTPAAAARALERIYQAAKAQGPSADPDEAAQDRALTIALFNHMRQLGIKPPTHSDTGLPKPASQRGYAMIYRALSQLAHGEAGATQASVQVQELMALAEQTRTDRGDLDSQAVQRVLRTMPQIPRNDRALLQDYVSHTLGCAVGLRLVGGGGAKGVSGAPVFLAEDQAGRVIGIAKVFPDTGPFVQELSSLAFLRGGGFQRLRAPEPLNAARLEGGGLLVVERAPGDSLDDLIARDGSAGALTNHLVAGVVSTADALAELHTLPAGSGGIATRAYVARHTRAIEEITGKLLAVPLGRAWLGRDLASQVEQVTRAFVANPGVASVAHGDAHPGNFFYDNDQGVTLIDTPTLHLSLGSQGQAIGLAARDVANFQQKLGYYGRALGLSPAQADHLQSLFRTRYEDAGGALLTSEADRFFAIRSSLGELLKTLHEQSDDASGDTDPSLQMYLVDQIRRRL